MQGARTAAARQRPQEIVDHLGVEHRAVQDQRVATADQRSHELDVGEQSPVASHPAWKRMAAGPGQVAAGIPFIAAHLRLDPGLIPDQHLPGIGFERLSDLSGCQQLQW